MLAIAYRLRNLSAHPSERASQLRCRRRLQTHTHTHTHTHINTHIWMRADTRECHPAANILSGDADRLHKRSARTVSHRRECWEDAADSFREERCLRGHRTSLHDDGMRRSRQQRHGGKRHRRHFVCDLRVSLSAVVVAE